MVGPAKDTDLFLGLDSSTQSLTAVAIDPSSGEMFRHAINFDERYPNYKTSGGVIVGEAPGEVHSDPLMWIEALDDMLNWLKENALAPRVRAVSVSAQQHGSVYLNGKAAPALSGLNPAFPLKKQLEGVFSRATSPVWMDSSTTRECREITEALGGDLSVAALTGSVATERFVGPQIRKFWKTDPDGFRETVHIALISSFITSLLTGRFAPLDLGDGLGTNLADVRSGEWSPDALKAAAPIPMDMLPELVKKDVVVGEASRYIRERYAFRPGTKIVVGSGDNPCSLVGLGLVEDEDARAVSLGTSDTYFGYMPATRDVERSEGHIFGAADGGRMFLLCFKNGSLAREKIRNRHRLSWSDFSEILLTTPPGNGGRIMLPYFSPEITPVTPGPGVHRFGGLAEDDAKGNVRAMAEAQIMSMYSHSHWAGKRPKVILATAGGSGNRGLLTVISGVFNAEVRSFEVRDSAALGAAIRAARCHLSRGGEPVSWKELAEPFIGENTAKRILPLESESQVYHGPNGLIGVYESCEKFALGSGGDPGRAISDFVGSLRR
ncbi:MAG: carbohydrate kinase [Desulfobacterales bacterium]|nr:carbohydrate kinase [Desulfobacterales bacterium]